MKRIGKEATSGFHSSSALQATDRPEGRWESSTHLYGKKRRVARRRQVMMAARASAWNPHGTRHADDYISAMRSSLPRMGASHV